MSFWSARSSSRPHTPRTPRRLRNSKKLTSCSSLWRQQQRVSMQLALSVCLLSLSSYFVPKLWDFVVVCNTYRFSQLYLSYLQAERNFFMHVYKQIVVRWFMCCCCMRPLCCWLMCCCWIELSLCFVVALWGHFLSWLICCCCIWRSSCCWLMCC